MSKITAVQRAFQEDVAYQAQQNSEDPTLDRRIRQALQPCARKAHRRAHRHIRRASTHRPVGSIGYDRAKRRAERRFLRELIERVTSRLAEA